MIEREEVLEKAKRIIADNVPDMFGTEIDEDTVLVFEGIHHSRHTEALRTLGDLVDAVMKHLPKEA